MQGGTEKGVRRWAPRGIGAPGAGLSSWAAWDEDLLAIELQELNASDFDLSLTGFDPREIDELLVILEEEEAERTGGAPRKQHSTRFTGARRLAK